MLQHHSQEFKKIRFNNSIPHQYQLRSKKIASNPSKGTNFFHLTSQYLLAYHAFQHNTNHIHQNDRKKETIYSLLNGANEYICTTSPSNEWERFTQGNKHGVRSTHTIDFIHRSQIPPGRDITCVTFVIDYIPLKYDLYRIRITIGGDTLSYNLDAGSPAANILETKVLLNITISDTNIRGRFMFADIECSFLATQMKRE